MRVVLLSALSLVLVASGCEPKAASNAAAADSSAAAADNTGAGSEIVRGKPQILSVTVRVRTADGKVGNVEIDPDKETGSDAVFFSVESVRNFLVPFYTARKGEGADSAKAILSQAQADLEKYGFIILPHKWKCKVLFPGDKLGGPFPIKL